jgi:hypothetical protein|tara:strand:- start:265 stop:744 length:480 start_codon:yes stop_codon:yes gene_type:complete
MASLYETIGESGVLYLYLDKKINDSSSELELLLDAQQLPTDMMALIDSHTSQDPNYVIDFKSRSINNIISYYQATNKENTTSPFIGLNYLCNLNSFKGYLEFNSKEGFDNKEIDYIREILRKLEEKEISHYLMFLEIDEFDSIFIRGYDAVRDEHHGQT